MLQLNCVIVGVLLKLYISGNQANVFNSSLFPVPLGDLDKPSQLVFPPGDVKPKLSLATNNLFCCFLFFFLFCKASAKM